MPNPFLSHLHQTIRQARITRHGATSRPEDVPQGVHKTYKRMEQIKLPRPQMPLADLGTTIVSRRSYFGGSEEDTLTLSQCSSLFGIALGNAAAKGLRNYPSGGALYPIETYLIGSVADVGVPAVFHYNPSSHMLEKLWNLPDGYVLKDLGRAPDDLLFSAMIVFTSVWKRSSAKYGDLTYAHALLEAGHMSQNVLLVATALGIQSRPYAGFNDESLIEILDIDPEEEQPVHTIVLSV